MKNFRKNPGESTQRTHDAFSKKGHAIGKGLSDGTAAIKLHLSDAKHIAIAATASLATIAALAGGGVATAYGVENLNAAKAEYPVVLGESNRSSKALKDAIDSANKLAEGTKDTDVADPNTLVNLKSYADNDAFAELTKAYSPEEPRTLHDYNRVIDYAEARKADIRTAKDALDRSVKAVEASKAEKLNKDARAALAQSINDAQGVYDSSNGKVDDGNVRNDLKAKLDDANSVKDTADRATADAKRAALDDAKNKVNDAVKSHDARVAQEAAAAQAASASSYGTSGRGGSYSASGYAGGSGITSISGVRNCTYQRGDSSTCQGAIDAGGWVRASSSDGSQTIYAAHDYMGGSALYGLGVGSKVNVGGRTYTVSGIEPSVDGYVNPFTGTALQTCVNGVPTLWHLK
ncbi:hypothetical protein [Bifidobacterium bifidum]|uniref:hypothetical protein n=1 Tax=Bifidobacterium bifidum TaxID=1681 RepID=UPI0006423E55|nr:hypothetical protein [Bifidobacterium bifidum]KLN81661.1 hypothetical protein B0085_1714 [Bifidobacterium bifidum]